MIQTLKKLLLDYTCSEDAELVEKFSDNAFKFKVGDTIYMVADDEGEANILQSYREALIDYIKGDILEEYWDFFDFNTYSEYKFQSLNDIYEDIKEINQEGNIYYICSI